MGEGYLLYHSIGMYPGKAEDIAAAMACFAMAWGRPDDAQWPVVLDLRARFIARWCAILGAPEGSVTTCSSVTAGVDAVLRALPPAHLRGKRVVVGADCFPSNHFLMQRLAPELGFTLTTVAMRQGAAHVEDEDFHDAITPDTGLVLLTWVSSTTSHRCDLRALTARARQMGALVGSDLTQAAGLLPVDVTSPDVDFAVSTSLKWMCGTPGAGALYVSPRLIPHLSPASPGWFSQENPFNWDIGAFAYAPDIRRFDSGTPDCVATLASLPALDWHATQDHPAILAANRRQTAAILDIARDLRLPVLTPSPEHRRGGSVMLRLPDDRPAAGVIAALRQKNLFTDHRGQTLRLSPGILSTDAAIARLPEALAQALR
jgi:kynureninase